MTTRPKNEPTADEVRKRLEVLRGLYKLCMTLKAAGAAAGLQPRNA